MCFHDSECLWMGCGLHGDLMPYRAVRIDWVTTKPACSRRELPDGLSPHCPRPPPSHSGS